MPYPQLTPQQRRAVLHPQHGTSERKHDVPSRSFTSLKLDWITGTAYDKRLNAIAFRVGVIIAQHVNGKTGRAFPSEQLMMDRTGLSRSTVIRAVKLLQATGWLCVRRKRTFDPKTRTHRTRNSYWLRHENVPSILDAIAAARRGRRLKGADQCVTGDTYQCVTGDTPTPTVQHLQRKDSARGGRMREAKNKPPPERMLPLVSVVASDPTAQP
jgi:hypothetical protein